MNQPGVTILVATYNQGDYLEKAIESALAQDLDPKDFEVSVIDDGSTDQTPVVLKRYESRVRGIRRKHSGLVESCNAGMSEAKGKWIGRLDSDDTVSPSWLSRLLGTAHGSQAVCITCNRYELFPNDRRQEIIVAPNNIYDLIACGSLIKAESLRQVKGFRPFYWEEYDLYLRLKKLGSFLHVPEPLYEYRKHAAAMTRDPKRREQGWIELIEEWGMGPLRQAGSHPELEAAALLIK